MGGVEALLKLLRNGLDGDAVRSIMQVGLWAFPSVKVLAVVRCIIHGSGQALAVQFDGAAAAGTTQHIA
jgi:hypothetical protein